MAHKFANVLVHVVFSTKERRSLIPPELERKLWRYMEGIGANAAFRFWRLEAYRTTSTC